MHGGSQLGHLLVKFFFSTLADGNFFKRGKLNLMSVENNPDELCDLLDGSDFEVDEEDDQEEIVEFRLFLNVLHLIWIVMTKK